jgi:SNF2 family DNA or RNA helicase
MPPKRPPSGRRAPSTKPPQPLARAAPPRPQGAADILAQMTEWFDGPDTAPPPKTAEESRRSVSVHRILECARCGWAESDAAPTCFRCGAPLVRDMAHDPTLRRLGVTLRPPEVVTHPFPDPAPSPDVASADLDPTTYLLRLERARLQLVQGFDTLLALDLIHVDHYAYQLAAARDVLSRMRGQALLADEVGLGKTIEAALIMKELRCRRLARRVLILTPASLVFQWQAELREKFREPFEVISSLKQWEALADDPDAGVILSLDRAKGDQHAAYIIKNPWDLIIIDEAHRLKNRSTLAYKFVKQIERRYMLMLTATPVHNDLTELYSLVDLLKPGQLGTVRAFREQFVKSGDPRSPENAPALRQLLDDVMIRNRRAEVEVRFPKRRAAVVHIDLPPHERALYDAVSAFIRQQLHRIAPAPAAALEAQAAPLGEVDKPKRAHPHSHLRLGLMTLQRELCSSPAAVAATLRVMAEGSVGEADLDMRAQLVAFAEMADGIGDGAKVDVLLDILEAYPGKFLVFTEFRHTQAALLRALADSGVAAAGFHGGLRAGQKEEAVQAFRGDVRVLVSTESGGEGRNLQFCHQLINYDLPWNPMRVEQRIGRVHRLGQTEDVTVFNLSTRDTLEAHLLDLLVKKIKMFELVVGELDLIIGDVERPGEVRSFEDMVVNAWMHAEDEVDLQVSFDQIGEQLEQARGRYLDARLLNEEVFDLIASE